MEKSRDIRRILRLLPQRNTNHGYLRSLGNRYDLSEESIRKIVAQEAKG